MTRSMPQSHSIQFDEASAILRVRHGLFQSEEAFEHYHGELRTAVALARHARGTGRFLFDNTQIEAVRTEAGNRIAKLGALFIPGDRIALLVGSSHIKTQFRDVSHAPTVCPFLSEHAAVIWLRAYDHSVAA